MAKSKSGGTRSFLRGRIANDVYSIGKDGKGKKQQVVRSLAESVANPQTTAQMRGRMIMATVMQAVSGLSQLIDHSFDGVATGQPSISEFIRRNYALIKADVAANPDENNVFGLNKYQEKGTKGGAYLVSAGSAILPSAVITVYNGDGSLTITKTTDVTTAAQIRYLLGMGAEDYLTKVVIANDGKVYFFRVSVSSTLADETVITSANADQLFSVDNPLGLTFTYNVGEVGINVTPANITAMAEGVIYTQKTSDGFIHSTCVLAHAGNLSFTADVALPTYPIGEERFLNGGEL